MTFLTIDENKCKQDGICAAECPRQIITQEDDASFPQVAEADEAYGMACGHCMAVCPHDALSVTGVDIEDCPEIKKNLVLSWDRAGLLRGAMLATPDLVESMGLPEGHIWFYPMMIGYPRVKYQGLPERKAPAIHWK